METLPPESNQSRNRPHPHKQHRATSSATANNRLHRVAARLPRVAAYPACNPSQGFVNDRAATCCHPRSNNEKPPCITLQPPRPPRASTSRPSCATSRLAASAPPAMTTAAGRSTPPSFTGPSRRALVSWPSFASLNPTGSVLGMLLNESRSRRDVPLRTRGHKGWRSRTYLPG